MTKWFRKWSKKSKISSKDLLKATVEIENKNAVDLGGGLFKVRLARANEGKSGGYRTLIVYKKDHLAMFVFGFAKNDKANLDNTELANFKLQAKQVLSLSEEQIEFAIKREMFFKLEK